MKREFGPEQVVDLDEKSIPAWRANSDLDHKSTFNTIVGKIRFDEKGEWAKPRLLMVQFQNVQGGDLDQYMASGKQIIQYPRIQGRRVAVAVRKVTSEPSWGDTDQSRRC